MGLLLLLPYSSKMARYTCRGECNWSLATVAKRQLKEETDPPLSKRPYCWRSQVFLEDLLAAHVSEELEDSTFRVAVRLANLDHILAAMNEVTLYWPCSILGIMSGKEQRLPSMLLGSTCVNFPWEGHSKVGL